MQVHEPIQGLSTGPRRVYVRLGIAVSVEMTMLGSTLHAVAALALLSTTSLALAQTDAVRNQQGLKHDFAADRLLVDAATLETVNDPAAADVLFREGTPILAILKDLTEKGFHSKRPVFPSSFLIAARASRLSVARRCSTAATPRLD